MTDNPDHLEGMSAEEFEARFLQSPPEELKTRDVTSEAVQRIMEMQEQREKELRATAIKSQKPQTPQAYAEYDRRTRRLYEEGFAMVTDGLDLDALVADQSGFGLWNRLKGAVSGTPSLNLFEEAVTLRSKKMVGWVEVEFGGEHDAVKTTRCEEGDFLAFMTVLAEDSEDSIPFFYREVKSEPNNSRLLIFNRGDLTPVWAGIVMVGGLTHLYYNLKGLFPDEPTKADISQRMITANDAMILAADHYSDGKLLKALVDSLGVFNLKNNIEIGRFVNDRESSDFIRVRDEMGRFFGSSDSLSEAELYSRGDVIGAGLIRAGIIRDMIGVERDFELFGLGKKFAFSQSQQYFNGGRLSRTALKGMSSFGQKFFANVFNKDEKK